MSTIKLSSLQNFQLLSSLDLVTSSSDRAFLRTAKGRAGEGALLGGMGDGYHEAETCILAKPYKDRLNCYMQIVIANKMNRYSSEIFATKNMVPSTSYYESEEPVLVIFSWEEISQIRLCFG